MPVLGDDRQRRAALALTLTALALVGAATASAAVAAQSDGPAVRVDGGTVAADGTTTVGVVLTGAPDGLAGYYLELAVEGEGIRIESASYPDRFGMTTPPAVGEDGRTVTLEAADVDGAVQAGASDVTLATVTVAGAAPGEVTLSVEPIQFDADDGSGFQPAVQPGAVTVGDGADGSTGDAGATGDDAGSPGNGAAASGGEATSGAGTLPAGLVVVALGTLALVGILRRRRA